MTVSVFDPTANILLTEAAEKYFSAQMANKPDSVIRLSTKVSGCTGFAYVLEIEDQPAEDDIIIKFSDFDIAVAAKSMMMIAGTEIDLVTEGINQVVKYNNPNVVAECGCGESFNVS
ncbi:HesB/IscA family protein [Psychromonas sp. GE-S-Ul-11]|jgi:iron-sulfur cluster assembly protein|uniref:HesB/IscA family protein n=1 Tax=unclassified Psychromonas TaxID=2614957 RepID=UPI00390C95AD